MEIEFLHHKRGNQVIFVSPQLPGWKCSAPTEQDARDQSVASLRIYLRDHPKLDPEVREALLTMVGKPAPPV